MYGALLGDMIGAPYEFDRGNKTKEFPLFCKHSQFTDDSVMTIAVAEALLNSRFQDDVGIRIALIKSMRKWGRKYPHAGYGIKFSRWLRAKDPEPYDSYGNGSAMRVSAAGWLFDTLEQTRHMAQLTSEVTHNHPEGIKGAEATASAIFLARTGHSKAEIKSYIVNEFGYDLSRTCDEIRPEYRHVESCQKTVPEAITAFLEGTDFEDVIRTAVSLGGDCDTLTCIAGSIAEAFYGVPADLEAECKSRLPEDMLDVLKRFDIAREHGHDISKSRKVLNTRSFESHFSTEDDEKRMERERTRQMLAYEEQCRQTVGDDYDGQHVTLLPDGGCIIHDGATFCDALNTALWVLELNPEDTEKLFKAMNWQPDPSKTTAEQESNFMDILLSLSGKDSDIRETLIRLNVPDDWELLEA